MLLTEHVASIDHSATAEKFLCEKSVVTVLCLGDDWKAVVQAEIRPHQIIHVTGRLLLKPMFIAQSAEYEYKHEINVSNQCGNLTVIRSEDVVSN